MPISTETEQPLYSQKIINLHLTLTCQTNLYNVIWKSMLAKSWPGSSGGHSRSGTLHCTGFDIDSRRAAQAYTVFIACTPSFKGELRPVTYPRDGFQRGRGLLREATTFLTPISISCPLPYHGGWWSVFLSISEEQISKFSPNMVDFYRTFSAIS